jgi:hypothetical protein
VATQLPAQLRRIHCYRRECPAGAYSSQEATKESKLLLLPVLLLVLLALWR